MKFVGLLTSVIEGFYSAMFLTIPSPLVGFQLLQARLLPYTGRVEGRLARLELTLAV